MSQSLYTAMGGISSATTQLSVISNNVANINTTAFKSSSVQFSDVYYTTLSYGSVSTPTSGGTNPIQIGVGVQTASVSTDFSTGSWVSTGSDTDLMINGPGFFSVQAADDSTFYTRAGDFSLDEAGNLVTSSGLKVLGTNSTLSSASSGITVKIPTSITATVSGNSALGAQLVTDLNGINNHITQGYFIVTDTTASPAVPYNITLPATAVDGSVTNLVARLNAQFTSTGAPVTASIAAADGKITFTSTSTPAHTLTFSTPTTTYTDTGTPPVTWNPSNFCAQAEITAGTTAGTYATKVLDWTATITTLSTATESTSANSTTINKDGSLEVTYKDGSTLSVTLNSNNRYTFIYTSPDSVAISGDKCSVASDVAVPANFVIQMATITNTEGLLAEGNNLYSAGPNTGDVIYTVAGAMGCGEVQSGGLEASNVDLSKELSNMILAQRAIQANSRVFTTTSDIMQTITQMGR